MYVLCMYVLRMRIEVLNFELARAWCELYILRHLGGVIISHVTSRNVSKGDSEEDLPGITMDKEQLLPPPQPSAPPPAYQAAPREYTHNNYSYVQNAAALKVVVKNISSLFNTLFNTCRELYV